MRLVIVTGMSGAGKSLVLKYLEDINYFCVDNLPPTLISTFVQLCFSSGTDIERVALGIDIRGGKLFDDLFSSLKKLKSIGYSYEILYMDASDEVLIMRYKESRRSHPLAKNHRVSEGIEKERQILTDVEIKAHYRIDTSNLLTRQLKEKINNIFLDDRRNEGIIITVISFGFKYGIPSDSDLVFDVRFIPNPFYIPELKPKTGEEAEIQEFVMKWQESSDFIEKLTSFLEFLIPNYIKEGKTQLVISIGCTGGKHRSVVLASKIHGILNCKNHNVSIIHRDIEKDSKL